MKKIAFIIEDFSDKGGRETVLATLANALCEYYDIHILCVTQKNDQIAYSLNSNIHYQYFTYFEGRTRERFARSVFKMRKYIKKHHIDCVIGVGSSTFMLCTIGTVFSKTKFITSAPKLENLPADTGIEIAFVGRSNAGKSSALNAITNIKNLAKTSKTPGRTQLINLFEIEENKRIVDLPGNGFANVPIAVKNK